MRPSGTGPLTNLDSPRCSVIRGFRQHRAQSRPCSSWEDSSIRPARGRPSSGQESAALLDEVLGVDFEKISLSALYRLSDALVLHREAIETRLQQNERHLFSLRESIIVYDLTNTFLTGTAEKSALARRGRSKEKRTDSPSSRLPWCSTRTVSPKQVKSLRVT